MTEEEARERILASASRETIAKLDVLVELLVSHASSQNLIAASTMDTIWSRHILDSAQLASLAPEQGLWIDIGTGAGLPGLVIALLHDRPMLLLEPRAKRCRFLAEVVDRLEIAARVAIVQSRAETAPLLAAPAKVISARAVAALPALFAMGSRFADRATTWLLPKGRSARAEVAAVATSWHASIRLEQSVTDSEAAIVVATAVSPRKRS